MATKASKRTTIYMVELRDEGGELTPARLVRASHWRTALAHVVQPIAKVTIPTKDELVKLLTDCDSPVTVEDAGAEEAEAEPEPAAKATQLPKGDWPIPAPGAGRPAIPHPGGDWPTLRIGEAP